MTTSPSAPLHLLDLGPYILHDVCTALCRHCRPKAIRLGWHENAFLECDDAGYSLASLSSTCRLLRDIAQPVLYHDVDPKALMPFLRTLMARPDLAARVRSFSNSRSGASEFTAEDRLLIQAGATAAGITLPPEWADSTSRLSDRGLVDGLITDHLLACLPRLAQLHHTKGRYQVLGRLLEPAGLVLDSLQRLELGLWDNEAVFSLKADRNATLLTAAPNLQCLKVHLCVYVEPGLPFQNIRLLRITNGCLSESSLQNLVSACPKLEAFGYDRTWQDWFGGEEISPGSAQRILRTCKDTLRCLNLDFGSYYLDECEGRAWWGEEYFESFRDFQVLERLVISPVWIRGSKVPGNDALVSILPESICTLSIPCDGGDGLLHGLVKVAVAVAQGRLPHLKEVQFDILAGAHEDIAQSCALAGVEGGTLLSAFGQFGVQCGNYAEYEEFLDFP